MRSNVHLIAAATLLLALAACSSPSLRVESAPDGADVLVARDGATPLKVGKTPFNLTSDNSPDLFSENIKVTVAKDGYLSESLFLPKMMISGAGQWLVNLKQTAQSQQAQDTRDTSESASLIAQGVAEAQQRVFQRNFAVAQRILEDLIAKHPNIAVLHDLLGNVFYVQRDTARALAAYKRSYELKPNSPETARMIEKLSPIHETRNPTGGR